jgi:hypothetical protein
MRSLFLSRTLAICCLSALLPVVCVVELCGLMARQHDHLLTTLPSMHEVRAGHTATVLPNGMVLIVGGFRKGADGRSQIYSRTAELYEPATKTFVKTGNMHVCRAGHTATFLPNGSVLIAGGFNETGSTATAEVYNPLTKSFSLAGSMSLPRGGATATLLRTGSVLIAGGEDAQVTASAEVFNPTANLFSPTGPMTVPRQAHTATLLPDGKVLILGGGTGRTVLASAEVYDPTTGVFTSSGTMTVPRYKHAAILLNDGHTLILGGSDERDWRGAYNSAEIYDWKSAKFTPIPSMASQRFKFPGAVVRLGSGNILVCGGGRVIEVFDFLMKHFKSVGKFDQSYYFATASVLNNGTVLILGGYTDTLQATSAAWIFKE